jgi:type IV pilus assembly protein PilV
MSMTRHTVKTSLASQGFTLIEVMISLLILAIGLLGMTALQNEALKFNHAASIDSVAQYLVSDIAERIRANEGNNNYAISFIEPSPVAVVDCAVAICSSDQLAVWDLSHWRAKVESSDYMPNGEGEITLDNLTRTFVISIRYDWSQLGGVDITDGKRVVTITTRI